jgi:TolA-binding protein
MIFYFNQKYQRAIRYLKQFRQDYPDSDLLSDVNYYLGDSYYRLQKWDSAVTTFDYVLAVENHPYHPRILDKRGKALQNTDHYRDAVKNYQLLLKKAVTAKDNYNALEGLMFTYYELENYDSVKLIAQQILDAEWKPVNAASLSILYQGKAAMAQNKLKEALDFLQVVKKSGQDVRSAEASYLYASILFQQQQYKPSVEALLQLIQNFGAYDQWTDQAYLLLVDNYLEMEEFLQAEATLISIIERSENQVLIQSAKEKMQRLEQLKSAQEALSRDTVNQVSADTTGQQ